MDCEIPHRLGRKTKEAELEGGGHEAVCQQGRWAPKGGGLEGPTLIGWRRERVPARTLDPKEGWIVRSHIGWEENETFFIRV